MRYFFLFCICTFLHLATSCRMDEEIVVNEIDDTVKKYVLFLPNSKWIFQNDSTQVKDTITVISSSITKECVTIDGDDDCWQVMKIIYYSSYTDTTFLDRSGSDTPWYIYRSSSRPSEHVFNSLDPYNVPSDPTFSSKEHLSSMDVNGLLYVNVYKLHANNKVLAGATGYLAFDYYWAPHHGNIKKVIYEDNNVTSWSLIDKDVHQ